MVEELDTTRSPTARDGGGNLDSLASQTLSHSLMSAPLQSSSTMHIVDDCRKQLADLRKVVKEVKTYKAKSVNLFSQASEVVVKLDDIIYNRSIDMHQKEQLIHTWTKGIACLG